MTGGGHLFVTAGDLTLLACDAVLIPTDRAFHITDAFAPIVGLDGAGVLGGQQWLDSHVVRLDGHVDRPHVWLADVVSGHGDDQWNVALAESFLSGAVSALGETVTTGARPLLAMPVLGTGAGGQEHRSGAVASSLIDALQHAVQMHGVDVVLVTRGRPAYSAAQRVRFGVLGDDSPDDAFDLGDEERDRHLTAAAGELARNARRGELVLFLGAGVSAGAGLPAWQTLIDGLARQLPTDRRPRLEQLHRLDLRDQAAVLRRRFPDEDSFHQHLQAQIDHTRHGLTHELAASLPTVEAVTTNYDTLFEQAVAATLDTIAVLPGQPAMTADRWLLKLHGDIGDASSMVLTREDYLRLPKSGGALFGLVQAMLMTRHMMFVGYSLSDEDFHSLVDEVRAAQAGAGRTEPFGTVLTLFEDELFNDLWEGDLTVLAMHAEPADPAGPSDQEFAVAARRLQIFLDLLGMLAAHHQAFLLNPSYDEMLTGEERRVRDALENLIAARPKDAGVEWEQVDALLSALGRPATSSAAPRRT